MGVKINNTDASHEAFRLVRSTLRTYDKEVVRGDFADREVSSQELQDFFDVDDNGSVALSDILAVEAKLGQGAFLRLDETLKKHGFAATSFVADRDFAGYVRGYTEHMKRGENVTIPEAERPFWGDAGFVMRAITVDWFALPVAEPHLLQDTDFCRRVSDTFFATAAQYEPDASGHGSLSLKTGGAAIPKNSFSGTDEMSSMAWWMIGNFPDDFAGDQKWIASVLAATNRFFGLGEQWVDFGDLAALRTRLGEEGFAQLEDQLWWQNASLDTELVPTSLEPYMTAAFNPAPGEDDLRLMADLQPFLRSSRFVANLVKVGSWAIPDGESVLLSDLLPDDLRLNVPFNLDVLALAPGWRDQMAPELWENPDVLHGALAMSEGWVEGKLLPLEVLRDHAFSLKMVRENPKTYSWQFAALPEMRADREIATAAMSCHDEATWTENRNHLPKKFKNDPSFWTQSREFFLNALQKDAEIWKYAGKLKSDREFQIQAVKTNPEIYFELDAKSRADQDVAFWALRSHANKFKDVKDMWRWFSILPESLKQDVSFWKKTFSEGYGFLPSSEWNCWDLILAQVPAMRVALSDAQVAQKLFSHYGSAVYYLGAGFGFGYDSDPESVKIAVRDEARAYSYCSPALQQDPNFCVELALVNFHVIGLYDATMQQQVWPKVGNALKQKGVEFPPEMMTSYSDFMAGLKSFTEFPERFRSFEMVYKIYTNNKTVHFNDDKPIVLLAYPKADSNTALDDYPVADALCADDRVHVLYVEIGDDGRLFNPDDNIFQWAMAKGGSPQGNKFLLAGHGTSSTLGLGSDQYKAQDIYNPYAERQTFDVGDFASNDFSDLLAFLGPKGEWLDLSCSNGNGGETNPDSIASRSAAMVPSGVRLNFTRIPNNLFGIALDEQGAFDIDWWRGSAYETYGTAAIASRGN